MIVSLFLAKNKSRRKQYVSHTKFQSMAKVRCTSCKGILEIDDIGISAHYDCPHCGKTIMFTSKLDQWIEKVYINQIEPDFFVHKSQSNDLSSSIIVGLLLIAFGCFSLFAWMFIVTIPFGLFCIWIGFGAMFSQSTNREVFCVYDKEDSRIVEFVYENGELMNSSQNAITLDERCRIVTFGYMSNRGDSGSMVWRGYLTQKSGPVRLICQGFSSVIQFAQHLGVTYEHKGTYPTENTLPDDAESWTEW